MSGRAPKGAITNGTSANHDVVKLQKFFDENPEVKFVQFVAMDLGATPRVLLTPRRRALEVAEEGFMLSPFSPVMVAVPASQTIMFDAVQMGIDEFRPDWSSLRRCTYYPAHAMVLCNCRQPQEGKPDGGYHIDPRSILAKQIQIAKQHGIDALIGLEIEFLIYDPSTTTFVGKAPQTTPLATPALRSKYTPIVDEIVLKIEEAGIAVMKFHPEDGGLGMYEIVLYPLSPLEAADAFLYCHETIKTVCHDHGLKATVAPTPYEGGMTIGSHTNLSISDLSDGKPEAFLAGLLSHMRAMAAFAMPSYDSYARKPEGRSWISWGRNNKLSLVRERRPGLWEIRYSDATINPYLTYAAFLAAGIEGIRTKMPLEIKNNDSAKFKWTAEDAAEYNVKEQLPRSLEEAVIALRKDKLLNDPEFGFGEELVKAYDLGKQKDISVMSGLTYLERRLAVMKHF